MRSLLVCLIFLKFIFSHADLFTSIAELETLVRIEKNLPKILKKFVDIQEHEILKNILDEAQFFYRNQTEITKSYSATRPLNAYHLVKRLYYVRVYLEEDENFEKILDKVKKMYGMSLPEREDFEGAVTGLFRLQDTYNLATQDLAVGEVYGQSLGEKLTAFDCLEITSIAHSKDDYYHVLLWSNESLARLKHENPPTASMEEILEYLANAFYEQGNVKRALVTTDKILKLDPQNQDAKENIEFYESYLASEGVSQEDMRLNIPPLEIVRSKGLMNGSLLYEALCRGDMPRDPKDASQLFCYYKADLPYLRLAPIKVEIVHSDPLIVLFRDVISDAEIQEVQKLATPKLARSFAYDAKVGHQNAVDFRISKTGWLAEEEGEVVKTVNNRIKMMTNLDLETAEKLQIANYGIAGYYQMHHDYADNLIYFDPVTGEDVGNRIATVLFYISQPELGGATVFPMLNLTLWPEKNSAAFWYNLKKDGDRDTRTLHAACPVLLGSKWISNKWIHEKGNEFTRGCDLDKDYFEKIVGY